jgi:hypothetical protein
LTGLLRPQSRRRDWEFVVDARGISVPVRGLPLAKDLIGPMLLAV